MFQMTISIIRYAQNFTIFFFCLQYFRCAWFAIIKSLVAMNNNTQFTILCMLSVDASTQTQTRSTNKKPENQLSRIARDALTVSTGRMKNTNWKKGTRATAH